MLKCYNCSRLIPHKKGERDHIIPKHYYEFLPTRAQVWTEWLCKKCHKTKTTNELIYDREFFFREDTCNLPTISWRSEKYWRGLTKFTSREIKHDIQFDGSGNTRFSYCDMYTPAGIFIGNKIVYKPGEEYCRLQESVIETHVRGLYKKDFKENLSQNFINCVYDVDRIEDWSALMEEYPSIRLFLLGGRSTDQDTEHGLPVFSYKMQVASDSPGVAPAGLWFLRYFGVKLYMVFTGMPPEE